MTSLPGLHSPHSQAFTSLVPRPFFQSLDGCYKRGGSWDHLSSTAPPSTNLQKFSLLKVSHYVVFTSYVCVLMYQLKQIQILSFLKGVLFAKLQSQCLFSPLVFLYPQVAQLINYAKNLHEEEKHIVRTLRLQQDAIW